MLRIVLIGPQGSGKGTQGERIAARYNIPTISTGQLYRDHIARGTPIGIEAGQYVKAGKLVPSDLTNRVMKDRLNESDAANGFILDGYPRNREQAEFLDTVMPPTHALLIQISDDEAVRRLSARWMCRKCGAIYNEHTRPPKVAGVCDLDGGELYQRDDDKPEAIRERLELYHTETQPVVDYYREKGVLQTVNGEQPIDAVFADAQKILG